jgi:hypothetical protein
MPDNPVAVIVYLVSGGIVGVWVFSRCPIEAIFVNYPTIIVSNVVKFIPALAILLGGQTTIQQEPVRKPDDHLTSQALAGNTSLDLAAYQLSATGGKRFKIDLFGYVRSSARLVGNLTVR